MERRGPAAVPATRSRTVREQRTHRARTPCPHRPVQRANAALVRGVGIGARRNQARDHRSLRLGIPGLQLGSAVDRVVQRFGAAAIAGTDIRTEREEPFGDVSLIGRRGDVECGIARVDVVLDRVEKVGAGALARGAEIRHLRGETGRGIEETSNSPLIV